MKNKGFNEILVLMKLHFRHLQIQLAKVSITGILDSPVLVFFSSVTQELWAEAGTLNTIHNFW
jgi:hypothetical protein